MARKLNIGTKLDFNEIDLTPPDQVLKELSDLLEKETDKIVSGCVKSYNGHITSYRTTGLINLSEAMGTKGRHVDIQDSLGKQGEEYHTFEFYLHTSLYEKYKFRICFIRFGMGNYPVKVVLEQSVADSAFSEYDSDYIVNCENRDEFEDLIMKILNSKRIIQVVQELIRIYQVQKQKGDDTEIIEESEEEISEKEYEKDAEIIEENDTNEK